MSLLKSEQFIKLNKKSTTDAYGETITWVNGNTFNAIANYQSNTNDRIAEKEYNVANWLLSIFDDVQLKQYDRVKRISDDKIFEIEKNNQNIKTPVTASFKFTQSYAREVAEE